MKPAAEKGSNVVPHLDLAYTVEQSLLHLRFAMPCACDPSFRLSPLHFASGVQGFDSLDCLDMASTSDAWAAKMSLEDLAKGVKATADMAGLELALDTSFLSREALLQAIQDCCSGLHPIPISS